MQANNPSSRPGSAHDRRREGAYVWMRALRLTRSSRICYDMSSCIAGARLDSSRRGGRAPAPGHDFVSPKLEPCSCRGARGNANAGCDSTGSRAEFARGIQRSQKQDASGTFPFPSRFLGAQDLAGREHARGLPTSSAQVSAIRVSRPAIWPSAVRPTRKQRFSASPEQNTRTSGRLSRKPCFSA